MKSSRRYAIAILSFTLIGIFASIEFTHAQTQEPSIITCPSCVSIPPEEIELYMELFPLIIWTDDSIFDHNSIIQLNGHLRPENAFHPVIITVKNPIGNIVTVEQVTAQTDGKFLLKLNTASNLWNKDGTYIIEAQSGSENRSFKTSVEIRPSGKPAVSACSSDEFNASGHCIQYRISAAKVTSASLDPNEKSLTVNIQSLDTGELILSPSRDIIQGIFMVLVDGEESKDFTIDGNTITIPFQNGAEKIELLATFVIPEFGTVAILTLVFGLILILVWNRKGLRINSSNYIQI